MEPPYGRYRYSPGGQTGYMTVIDLQRFVDAQDDHGTFARALDELAA